MKIFIYFILIIAFLMFYQQNPVFAVVIVVLFLAIYIFFKSRKNSGLNNRGMFFSGRNRQQNDKLDDLITLVLLQQVMEPSHKRDETYDKIIKDRVSESQNSIDKIKEEVIDLLKG
ncbi:MAG: hypothetical protein ACFFHV_15235 [Promethearchaeota archaeon]